MALHDGVNSLQNKRARRTSSLAGHGRRDLRVATQAHAAALASQAKTKDPGARPGLSNLKPETSHPADRVKPTTSEALNCGKW